MKRRPFQRCVVLMLTSLVSLACLAGAVDARVIRVRASAPGPTHDGNSWEHAYTSVSEALAASLNLDEIWVAEGTYAGVIDLKFGVALYGGFSGVETSRDQRDTRVHTTILDGERKGTVVTTGPNAGNSVLDGFTIVNGQSAWRTYYGPAYVALTKPAGGGVFAEHSRTVFANLVIRDCAGYGLDCRGESSITLRDSIITGCDNAAVFSEDSTPLITHNVIRGNGHEQGGGFYGGAIVTTMSSRTITGNLIVGNGAGVQFRESRPCLVNNTIADNRNPVSVKGAGVTVSYASPYTRPDDPLIVNNIIAYNDTGITYALPVGMAFPDTDAIHHNLVAHNVSADYENVASEAVPAANISKAPAFLDRRNGDYHLSPLSPCIDAGDPSVVQQGATDIDGEDRVQLRCV